MEKAPRLTHFVPVEEIWEDRQRAFEDEKKALQDVLSGIEAEFFHIGGSSIPGVLTKGDLDIQIHVPAEDFETSVERMKEYASEKAVEVWTPQSAVFVNHRPDFPIDYILSVKGSIESEIYMEAKNLLQTKPEFLAEYNALKNSFEGKPYEEYRVAKTKFWDAWKRRFREEKE